MNDVEHWYEYGTIGGAAAMRRANLTNEQFIAVIRAMRQTYCDDQRFTRSNVEHHLILGGHTTG